MTNAPTVKPNPDCEYKVEPATDRGCKGWRLSARPNGTEAWLLMFGLFGSKKQAVEYADDRGWKPEPEVPYGG